MPARLGRPALETVDSPLVSTIVKSSPPAAARGESAPPSRPEIDRVIDAALAEDLGPGGLEGLAGDATTAALVPPEERARAVLIAKTRGVLCGLDVFLRVFERLDPACRVVQRAREDGTGFEAGERLVVLEGRARALLSGERTALNLIQRLSGIATLTARYVERAGAAARVLDTRKTTPGLRALERYAVRCGGGENHRFGLYDQAMIKDNHVDLARAHRPARSLADLVQGIRARHGDELRLTVEARDADEALQAVQGGADCVLLDNLDAATLGALCPRLRAAARARGRQVELEASGGIDLENVAAIARSGVDRVSIGALTHSAPALDLSLQLEGLA